MKKCFFAIGFLSLPLFISDCKSGISALNEQKTDHIVDFVDSEAGDRVVSITSPTIVLSEEVVGKSWLQFFEKLASTGVNVKDLVRMVIESHFLSEPDIAVREMAVGQVIAVVNGIVKECESSASAHIFNQCFYSYLTKQQEKDQKQNQNGFSFWSGRLSLLDLATKQELGPSSTTLLYVFSAMLSPVSLRRPVFLKVLKNSLLLPSFLSRVQDKSSAIKTVYSWQVESFSLFNTTAFPPSKVQASEEELYLSGEHYLLGEIVTKFLNDNPGNFATLVEIPQKITDAAQQVFQEKFLEVQAAAQSGTRADSNWQQGRDFYGFLLSKLRYDDKLSTRVSIGGSEPSTSTEDMSRILMRNRIHDMALPCRLLTEVKGWTMNPEGHCEHLSSKTLVSRPVRTSEVLKLYGQSAPTYATLENFCGTLGSKFRALMTSDRTILNRFLDTLSNGQTKTVTELIQKASGSGKTFASDFLQNIEYPSSGNVQFEIGQNVYLEKTGRVIIDPKNYASTYQICISTP